MKKNIILLLIVLLFTQVQQNALYAMERCNSAELEPLLQNEYAYQDEPTFSFDTFREFSLNQPELAAYIFYFLPPHDRCLNYIIRWWLQPKETERIENSPYYPILKKIHNAHLRYLVKKCKEYNTSKSSSSIEKYPLATTMTSFMKTTKFVFLSIKKLDQLMPPYTSDALLLPTQEIDNTLKDYLVETKDSMKFMQDETNNDKKIVNYFLQNHKVILNRFRNRLLDYPYYENDRIYLESNPSCSLAKCDDRSSGCCMGVSGGVCLFNACIYCSSSQCSILFPLISSISFGGIILLYSVADIAIRKFNNNRIPQRNALINSIQLLEKMKQEIKALQR